MLSAVIAIALGAILGALQQGRLAWAAATVGSHVLGSVALTFAGLATPALLRR